MPRMVGPVVASNGTALFIPPNRPFRKASPALLHVRASVSTSLQPPNHPPLPHKASALDRTNKRPRINHDLPPSSPAPPSSCIRAMALALIPTSCPPCSAATHVLPSSLGVNPPVLGWPPTLLLAEKAPSSTGPVLRKLDTNRIRHEGTVRRSSKSSAILPSSDPQRAEIRRNQRRSERSPKSASAGCFFCIRVHA
jgi:hypothetical protein